MDDQMPFLTVDINASCSTELETVLSSSPQIPLDHDHVAQQFTECDVNIIRHLDQMESSGFLQTLKSRTEELIRAAILPLKETTAFRKTLNCQLYSSLDPHQRKSTRKKFPIFIVSISFIEWIFYKYLMFDAVIELLVFHPMKRYQLWRFVTPLLVHIRPAHLWSNVIIQTILGSLLETIHCWKPVAIVYFGGVIFGTLLSSVVQPSTFLIGASGGLYSLLFAHLATLILNWDDISHAFYRFVFLLTYIAYQLWAIMEDNFSKGKYYKISYAGHVGGALGGLLVGINVLKNSQPRGWEIKLQRVFRCIIILTLAFFVWANCYLQITLDPKDSSEHFFNVISDNVTLVLTV